VSINADDVSISGFTVNGNGTFGWGITIRGSNCVVKNNDVFGIDGEGIFLDGRANNVEGNLVTNNTLRNNKGCGVLAWGANKNCIRSNTASDNYFGIYLYWESNENMIVHNDIHNNTDIGVGIIWHSNNNSIIDNDISENGQYSNESYASGICSQTYSQSNYIINNELDNNKRGYYEYYSAGQIIYHNSFTNNSQQFVIDSQFQPNILDHGYPSGGNYWSDYNGTDSNSDGIGDTPYIIDANNQDHYPLVNPWQPILGDINYDGAVNILDIVAIASIYGCKGEDLRWNPQADLAPPYGKIDLFDLVTCTSHYGQTYP
jgi:parallel beta-helix repeat protein